MANCRWRGSSNGHGSKSRIPPSEHPNPTTKIVSKMGGGFTYQPKWDPKTVLTVAGVVRRARHWVIGHIGPWSFCNAMGWATLLNSFYVLMKVSHTQEIHRLVHMTKRKPFGMSEHREPDQNMGLGRPNSLVAPLESSKWVSMTSTACARPVPSSNTQEQPPQLPELPSLAFPICRIP